MSKTTPNAEAYNDWFEDCSNEAQPITDISAVVNKQEEVPPSISRQLYNGVLWWVWRKLSC
jgi:hypothetical protein